MDIKIFILAILNSAAMPFVLTTISWHNRENSQQDQEYQTKIFLHSQKQKRIDGQWNWMKYLQASPS